MSVSSSTGRIVTHLKKNIRRHVHKPDLVNFWIKKFNWENGQEKMLDDEPMKRYLRKLQRCDHRRAVQLRSGWLPCNRQCSRYMLSRTDQCSACNGAQESIEHIFQCQSRRADMLLAIGTTLDKKLQGLNTYSDLRLELIASLKHWVTHGTHP